MKIKVYQFLTKHPTSFFFVHLLDCSSARLILYFSTARFRFLKWHAWPMLRSELERPGTAICQMQDEAIGGGGGGGSGGDNDW